MFKFFSKLRHDPNDQQPQHLIELKDVVKAYKTDAGDFLALKGINLTVDEGEFIAIVGKSGSGKSTLINMLTGIDRPTGGEVHIAGTGIHNLNEGEMAKWRGRNQGVIFQFFQLLPTLTVIENVMLPMDFCHLYTPRERHERAMYLLDSVGVADQAKKLPTAISGGQQQRVAIARALANDPPMVMADEPTGNLDSRTAKQVFELFERLVDEGKTFLMVTHDDDLAQRVSRTIVIADGELVNEWLVQALPTLSQEMMVRATKESETRTFAPGEPIINPDSDPDSLYIVTDGKAQVRLDDDKEGEIDIQTLEPGDPFGETALVDNEPHQFSVYAADDTPTSLIQLPRDLFFDIFDESEETQEHIQRLISERRDVLNGSSNGTGGK
jgi:ABC-type lipoprotein export system ATPase subunit